MLNILELFAGGGAPHKALTNIGIKTITEVVEFDKHPLKIYNAIHGTKHQVEDVTNYEPKRSSYDLVWASTPCQAFSTQGKQLGAEDPKKGIPLWYATLELIKKAKAPIVIMENVKGLTYKKHAKLLEYYLTEMEKLGYENKYQVVYSNNFGTPQKRGRVFIVSIKGTNDFEFPQGQEFNKTIKEYLGIKELKADRPIKISSFKSENKFTDIHSYKTHTLTRTGALMRVKLVNSNNEKLFRYTTPLENMLLQGFTEEDYNKAKEIASPTQIYNMVGNSIHVGTLEAIFTKIYKGVQNEQN